MQLHAQCLPLDSLLEVNDTAAVTALSAECFGKGLSSSNRNAATLIPFIERYCRTKDTGDTLLFCAYRSERLRHNASVFAAIFHEWTASVGTPLIELQRYLKTGDFRRIDTLCAILDAGGGAEPSVLMRWIEAKKIIGDLNEVPELFCRITTEKPALLAMALDQFAAILGEAERAETLTLLDKFSRCCSAQNSEDSSDVMSWLLEQYGRRFDVDGQIRAVLQFETEKVQQSGILRSMGQQYHREGLEDAAIAMGKAAYDASDKNDGRKESSALLFTIYRARGSDDSARIWMERAGSAAGSVDSRIAHVVVFQTTGALDSAAYYLEKMPSSPARDTLYLRQLLFTDSAQAALRYVYSPACHLTSLTGEKLWKLRCALFAGAYEKVRAVLDSASRRERVFGSEPTDYRYWLSRLSGSPEELAKFSTIEYTLFKGERRRAAEIICNALQREPNRWRIALRIAGAQVDHGEYADALATLACAPADSEPEYLYRCAEALMRNGEVKAASEKVNVLLAGYPASVFAVRGRMLLMSAAGK